MWTYFSNGDGETKHQHWRAWRKLEVDWEKVFYSSVYHLDCLHRNRLFLHPNLAYHGVSLYLPTLLPYSVQWYYSWYHDCIHILSWRELSFRLSHVGIISSAESFVKRFPGSILVLAFKFSPYFWVFSSHLSFYYQLWKSLFANSLSKSVKTRFSWNIPCIFASYSLNLEWYLIGYSFTSSLRRARVIINVIQSLEIHECMYREYSEIIRVVNIVDYE